MDNKEIKNSDKEEKDNQFPLEDIQKQIQNALNLKFAKRVCAIKQVWGNNGRTIRRQIYAAQQEIVRVYTVLSGGLILLRKF
jgi:hypothetical protein